MRLTCVIVLWAAGFCAVVSRLVVVAAADGAMRVEGGLISGVTDTTSGVRAFKGIPFAAPPTGDLRWRPPAPVRPWEGVRRADQYAAPCLQPVFPGGPPEVNEILRLPGTPNEDCLYLNVWSAAKSANERRPVMVWIHGGALVIGSPAVPATDGAALAKKGVVLVSINYRLGAFGFLAHPELTKESTHASSGNYGLLDQLAALQWVQKNIAQFGGDPKNVTIFGESAGSWSVNLLVASPLGKGLFQRAIGESGALLIGSRDEPTLALNSQALVQAEQRGAAFATVLGARSLSELRAKTAEEVMKAATLPGNPLNAGFGATVDGWVLPDSADRIFAAGRQNDVPTLIGSNANEGALFLAQPVPAAASREQAARTYGVRADEFLRHYPASTDEQARSSAMQYMGDAVFGLQMRTWARLQKKTGKAAAYLYLFDRIPPDSACKCATHGSEIVYAFNNVGLSTRPFQQADRKLADTMSSYWVNFATKGDPNGPSVAKWAPYAEDSDMLMALGDRVEPRPVPHRAALDFLEAHFRRHQGAGATYSPPQLPWGAPDLQGVWANNVATPLERPDELRGRTRLTDEEVAKLRRVAAELFDGNGDAAFGDAVFLAALRTPEGYKSTDGRTGNYNAFWVTERVFEDRTSLITDPPDGRKPPLTPKAEQVARSVEAMRREPPADAESLPLQLRCITYGVPNTFAGYNTNYQIFQTPTHVVVLGEMIHDARIIPLDGRPHVSSNIRQWLGDARGHWEGHTLVVETTNFLDQSFNGQAARRVNGDANLRLTERFTRVGPDELQYEFTIDDPTIWTRPWSAMIPYKATHDTIYEYACHEGNYGMHGILAGARVEDRVR